MSKKQCNFCEGIFDESELVQGTTHYVPYGEGVTACGTEMNCPYCGESDYHTWAEVETNEDFEEMFNLLIDRKYFTEEELILLTSINEASIETLNDAIYARYAYRDITQLIDSEGE